jgi:two-component system response regulator LytT
MYIIDESLTELEAKLDAMSFFRINRQYIVNINAISKFKSIEQSRIKIELLPNPKEEIFIGKEHAGLFRKWIKGQ